MRQGDEADCRTEAERRGECADEARGCSERRRERRGERRDRVDADADDADAEDLQDGARRVAEVGEAGADTAVAPRGSRPQRQSDAAPELEEQREEADVQHAGESEGDDRAEGEVEACTDRRSDRAGDHDRERGQGEGVRELAASHERR